MPSCAAVGCSNRREKGFLMKSFPRNKLRRAMWAAQVNRAAWSPSDRSCLCQIHFDDTMWMPGTTKLKPNAIPTLLLRQPHNNRSSSKKYYDDSMEEDLKDEEETLMWISSPATSNQDPLALAEDINIENDKRPETETDPLVLCKEEIEVWTEDCLTGMQRIENYKMLEKHYEVSGNSTNPDINEDIPIIEIENESEVEIRQEELCSSVKDKNDVLVVEDSYLGVIPTSIESKNLPHEPEIEDITILAKDSYKALQNFSNIDEESKDLTATGMQQKIC